MLCVRSFAYLIYRTAEKQVSHWYRASVLPSKRFFFTVSRCTLTFDGKTRKPIYRAKTTTTTASVRTFFSRLLLFFCFLLVGVSNRNPSTFSNVIIVYALQIKKNTNDRLCFFLSNDYKLIIAYILLTFSVLLFQQHDRIENKFHLHLFVMDKTKNIVQSNVNCRCQQVNDIDFYIF